MASSHKELGVSVIHTVPSTIAIFRKMFDGELPGVRINNLLDDYILQEVANGGNRSRCEAYLLSLLNLAAQTGSDLVLCACSSLSGLIDELKGTLPLPVVKVDEAAVEQVVRVGSKVALLATAESTIAPTENQLRQEASRQGGQIDISSYCCPEAMEALKAGDVAGHNGLLAEAAGTRQEFVGRDVIFLPQVSMTPAIPLVEAAVRCQVVGSALPAVRRVSSLLHAISNKKGG